MKTRWGKSLDPGHVLEDYPRPQMRRDDCLILNGTWHYAITKQDTEPEEYDGEIIVPFSPECELSGVMRNLGSDETLWYSLDFCLPESWQKGRMLLHLGAIDQVAEVYLNGCLLGSHTGGYTAFSFDMTPFLQKNNVLIVKAKDVSDTSYHSRGKQKTKRGGIWYTPQSGIWQTVWTEPVPDKYIEKLKITPLFDEGTVEITAYASSGEALPCAVRCDNLEAEGLTGTAIRLVLGDFIAWSPEQPKLYDFGISMGEDRIQSYFAMRKFSVEKDAEGKPRLFLNNEPYFHNGVLDQGYWPDGLYTAPSDEAMIADIAAMKGMGFNTLRKHIKIEPMRWYYHCDRLGMLVWQDMPNGGGGYSPFTISVPAITGMRMSDGPSHYKWFARDSAQGRKQYSEELHEMIEQLYNCPSIAVWVPFNEGWGQFDAANAREEILSLDKTRTIDHASGWHDQRVGEVESLHVYFRPYRFQKDRLGRAVLLTEFGGYNLRIPGHCFNEKDFGYKRFGSAEELFSAFAALYQNEIIPAKRDGLAAAIYTQLTDVEDELNGFMTYDREIEKMPRVQVRSIMEKLKS